MTVEVVAHSADVLAGRVDTRSWISIASGSWGTRRLGHALPRLRAAPAVALRGAAECLGTLNTLRYIDTALE